MRALILQSTRVRNRAALCVEVGIDGSNLYKYEKGDTEPPIALLVDIAEKLGVTIDQLYPTKLQSEEPQHAGWRAFKASELGRSMTEEELADLAAVHFRNRLPTAEFYAMTLHTYRGFTRPMEADDALSGAHDMRAHNTQR